MPIPRISPALAALALLGVAACASPEAQAQQDRAQCSSYGFAPGTPDFAACLQRESLARDAGSGLHFGFGLSAGF